MTKDDGRGTQRAPCAFYPNPQVTAQKCRKKRCLWIGHIQQWLCAELGIQAEVGDAREERDFIFHSQLNLEMDKEHLSVSFALCLMALLSAVPILSPIKKDEVLYVYFRVTIAGGFSEVLTNCLSPPRLEDLQGGGCLSGEEGVLVRRAVPGLPWDRGQPVGSSLQPRHPCCRFLHP